MDSRLNRSKMRPEIELLLLATRVRTEPENLAHASAILQSIVDWDFVLRTANDHGVLPQLYRYANNIRPETIPETVLNQLRDESNRNTRSNLSFVAVLFKILDRLEANQIRGVPYKGPALAACAYGDVALRQFCDLDLILLKKDVLKAKELLIREGWRPEFELDGTQEEAFLKHYYDYAFLKNGHLVELHWQLTESYFNFPINIEQVFSRLQPVTVAGRETLTVAPEDSLLILCAHSSKHLWSRLGWICDVANLIDSHPGLKWNEIWEHATLLGSRRMLSVGLLLSIELLGAPVPEDIAARAGCDPAARALTREFRDRLFEKRDERPGIIENSKLHMRMRERARDRFTYASRLWLGTTVGDWTSLKVPRSLFFLYYLVRPVRLLGKSVRAFLNRLSFLH